jgi:carbonic anhydrase
MKLTLALEALLASSFIQVQGLGDLLSVTETLPLDKVTSTVEGVTTTGSVLDPVTSVVGDVTNTDSVVNTVTSTVGGVTTTEGALTPVTSIVGDVTKTDTDPSDLSGLLEILGVDLDLADLDLGIVDLTGLLKDVDIKILDQLGISRDDPNLLSILDLGILQLNVGEILGGIDTGVWDCGCDSSKMCGTGGTLSPKFCYDPTDNTCGPAVWPLLPFEKNECGGTMNSPIEIMSSEMCSPLPYTFNGGTCTWGDLTYKINDHSIKAEYPDSCVKPSFMVGKLEYEMAQFHIHLGQEHSIDGMFASASLHMVHTLKVGGTSAQPFAVVGFGMKAGTVVGENNVVLDHILSGFVTAAKSKAKSCACETKFFWEGMAAPMNMADPYALLPEMPSFFIYKGGLTTPPCSEVVFWNFLNDYVPVSVSQADTITQLILGYLDAECKLGTVADPKTGNTSRPPFAPGKRLIAQAGSC